MLFEALKYGEWIWVEDDDDDESRPCVFLKTNVPTHTFILCEVLNEAANNCCCSSLTWLCFYRRRTRRRALHISVFFLPEFIRYQLSTDTHSRIHAFFFVARRITKHWRQRAMPAEEQNCLYVCTSIQRATERRRKKQMLFIRTTYASYERKHMYKLEICKRNSVCKFI